MGGWVQVSLGEKKWENVPKSSYTSTDILGQYAMCILFVYTLLKVVSHDLSVLSMSAMGFQKKFRWAGGEGFFGYLFLTLPLFGEKCIPT